MSQRAIPLVDLSKYNEGSAEDKKQFVSELGRAFHEVGFVGVVNHGIPKSLVDEFYASAKAFSHFLSMSNEAMRSMILQGKEDILHSVRNMPNNPM